MVISEALQIPIVGFFLQPSRGLELRPPPKTMWQHLFQPMQQLISSSQFNAVLKQCVEMLPDGGISLNYLRSSRGLQPLPAGVMDHQMQYAELTA